MSNPTHDAGWRHHLIRIAGGAGAMLLATALLAVAMADRGDASGVAGTSVEMTVTSVAGDV